MSKTIFAIIHTTKVLTFYEYPFVYLLSNSLPLCLLTSPLRKGRMPAANY